MGKKTKQGPTRHDKWYYLAKERGYRSRAAFKLIQLNKKYNFLSGAKALVDLCAAPGGWLQVAAEYMPRDSIIIGVDLLPIKAIPGVVTFQEDILGQRSQALIRKELNGWKVDVIIHDGAPNVGGGTWLKDAYGQVELVLMSLKMATEWLKKGGWFVTKVFRSKDYNALLWVLQKFFQHTDVTKPVASRNTSAEIYVVCKGYLAPAEIDSRLLDPKFVFKEAEPGKEVVSVLSKKRKRREREGYADDAKMTLGRTLPVAQFVATNGIEAPKLLSQYTAMSFTDDDESAVYLKHAATDDEIRELCKDLQVLGKNDFRRLLRWRKTMAEFRKELEQERDGDGDSDKDKDDDEAKYASMTVDERRQMEEEKIDQQLGELAQKMRHAKRKEKRKALEKRRKERNKMKLNQFNQGSVAETSVEQGLFSIDQVKTEDGAEKVLAATHNEDDLMDVVDTDEEIEAAHRAELEESEVELDSDEEIAERQRQGLMEEQLDLAYDAYKERRKIVVRADRKKKKRLIKGLAGEEDDDAETAKLLGLQPALQDDTDDSDSSDSEDEDISDDDDGSKMRARQERRQERRRAKLLAKQQNEKDKPLVVSFDEPEQPSAKRRRVNRFFDDDMFSSIGADSVADDAKHQHTNRKNKNSRVAVDSESGSDADDDDREGDDADNDDDMYTGLAPAEAEALRLLNSAWGDQVSTSTSAPTTTKGKNKKTQKQNNNNNNNHNSDSDSDSDFESSVRKSILKAANKNKKNKAKKQRKASQLATGDKEGADFEIVAEESDFSSDSDAIAETMALGTHMLRKKKRTELINDSYNRYAFHDVDLPDWFVDEEERHNQRQLPVTKQEVDTFKQQLMAINARPIKKIAEARARKKVNAVRRWEKLKAKAQQIVDSSDMRQGEKLRAVEKLYRKGNPAQQEKKERKYLVATKGAAKLGKTGFRKLAKTAGGKPYKIVDKRMKADKRGLKIAAKKAKKRQAKRNTKRYSRK